MGYVKTEFHLLESVSTIDFFFPMLYITLATMFGCKKKMNNLNFISWESFTIIFLHIYLYKRRYHFFESKK